MTNPIDEPEQVEMRKAADLRLQRHDLQNALMAARLERGIAPEPTGSLTDVTVTCEKCHKTYRVRSNDLCLVQGLGCTCGHLTAVKSSVLPCVWDAGCQDAPRCTQAGKCLQISRK